MTQVQNIADRIEAGLLSDKPMSILEARRVAQTVIAMERAIESVGRYFEMADRLESGMNDADIEAMMSLEAEARLGVSGQRKRMGMGLPPLDRECLHCKSMDSVVAKLESQREKLVRSRDEAQQRFLDLRDACNGGVERKSGDTAQGNTQERRSKHGSRDIEPGG